jgi:hypothetical protein
MKIILSFLFLFFNIFVLFINCGWVTIYNNNDKFVETIDETMNARSTMNRVINIITEDFRDDIKPCKIVIFSGKHGTSDGNLGSNYDDFYNEDLKIADAYNQRKDVQIVIMSTQDMDNDTLKALVNSLQKTNHLILAWCFSNQWYQKNKSDNQLEQQILNLFMNLNKI